MATATATKTTAGFKVPCPECGHTEGLCVRVHDLVVTCTECSTDVERAALEEMVADAQRLLRLLDLADSV
jgi:uncharacterized protein (DUF983 family)